MKRSRSQRGRATREAGSDTNYRSRRTKAAPIRELTLHEVLHGRPDPADKHLENVLTILDVSKTQRRGYRLSGLWPGKSEKPIAVDT